MWRHNIIPEVRRCCDDLLEARGLSKDLPSVRKQSDTVILKVRHRCKDLLPAVRKWSNHIILEVRWQCGEFIPEVRK